MAQLLDSTGRPIRRKDLTEELAAAGLVGVRQVWTPDVASGLTPQMLAGVIRAADEGEGHDLLALAEQMEERDPHYASVLGTRKRAVSGVEPVVTAASESAADKRIADAVRDAIAEHPDFSILVEELLDGLGKGYSVVEIDWETRASAWTPRKFIHRDPRFFRFDRETLRELRLLTDENPADGEPLAPFKFIAHKPRLKTGIPLRGGLARLAAFTWICKAYTLKDWVGFIEVYGMPLRLGRYDASASAQDIEKLFEAVSMIGSDAAAVIPDSMRIEFQETGRGTGHEIFERLAKWADEQISKAILGQTMTVDSGSSYAQAEVHNDVRLDIRKADAMQVSGTLQRDLVRPFVDLNFGRQAAYPILTLPVEDPEDVKVLAESVALLADRGLTFSAEEMRAKLGLRTPAEGEEKFGGGDVAPPAPETAAARLYAALNQAGGAVDDPYRETDDLEGVLLDDWAEVMDPITAEVEQLLREAGSFEEARERLPELFGQMEAAAIIDTLVKAGVKARGEGEAAD